MGGGERFSHLHFWYIYEFMCLPFKVLFCKIWSSDWWVSIRDEGAQIKKKYRVYFEQIIVKKQKQNKTKKQKTKTKKKKTT